MPEKKETGMSKEKVESLIKTKVALLAVPQSTEFPSLNQPAIYRLYVNITRRTF
jgi:hypothetical protein